MSKYTVPLKYQNITIQCKECGDTMHFIGQRVSNKKKFCDKCIRKHQSKHHAQWYQRRKEKLKCGSLSLLFCFILGGLCVSWAGSGDCKIGTASWYSVESCKKEGTWQKYGGKMACGEVFDDEDFVCATWDYPFHTVLLITCLDTGKSVRVVAKDRGPSKRLYRRGRIIDLSKRAFAEIADLDKGIIRVKVEKVK